MLGYAGISDLAVVVELGLSVFDALRKDVECSENLQGGWVAAR